jgi:hypothetical protein
VKTNNTSLELGVRSEELLKISSLDLNGISNYSTPRNACFLISAKHKKHFLEAF